MRQKITGSEPEKQTNKELTCRISTCLYSGGAEPISFLSSWVYWSCWGTKDHHNLDPNSSGPLPDLTKTTEPNYLVVLSPALSRSCSKNLSLQVQIQTRSFVGFKQQRALKLVSPSSVFNSLQIQLQSCSDQQRALRIQQKSSNSNMLHLDFTKKL